MPNGADFVPTSGLAVQDADPAMIAEYVEHSWLDGKSGLNPTDGETVPPAANGFAGYDTNDRYTWAKAPRYDGKSTEVGPLARMIVAYLKGVAPVKAIVDATLTALGAAGKPEVLVSLLGRIAARNLETAVIADWSIEWVNELIAAFKGGGAEFFTASAITDGEGAGLWEAPRGALGHWMNVQDGLIANYQIVTPSTWDISPRDADGVRGPMEEALVGTPILDPERPMEAGRVARSFDP
jgi:Ni,Fe-hydrogenase I large subunit